MKDVKFKFKQVSKVGSDETALLDVTFEEQYTVDEFVNSILKYNRGWGKFYIDNRGYAYRYGELREPIYEDKRNLIVHSAKASGGWGRMDYFFKTKKEQ